MEINFRFKFKIVLIKNMILIFMNENIADSD